MITKEGFYGFLFGGVTGAFLMLLYAPRSGKETRRILTDQSMKLKEKTVDLIQETEFTVESVIKENVERVKEINQEAKQRISKLQDIGQTTLEEQKESLGKGLKAAKIVLQGESELEKKEN